MKPLIAFALIAALPAGAQVSLSRAGYDDRVKAAWLGQILGTLMGFQFEHKPRAVERVTQVPERFKVAPIDDDYHYELIALEAFERHGLGLTVEQLGAHWKETHAGAWGSSEQTRLLLQRGIKPPLTGHPRYNRLWFSIGPQFSADIYGMVAPGMPNVAGRLARELGHINGYAEGTDGAVFVAGMVSLAFVETDPRQVVKKAAQLIHPKSPYRQCLDLVIGMAESGASASEVADAVEDRWHMEYPATNNAVANGGLVALSVWFGEGDYYQTVNHAFAAADFTDADCNAANAGAVVGAMKGMRALPADQVARLNDRIRGDAMGGVKITPPVDVSITDVARRTAALGARFLAANGGSADGQKMSIPRQAVQTQEPELFSLAGLMQYWNPEWKLARAGFGAGGGGMMGVRGITYLDGEVLVTYPRDEVRSAMLERTAVLGAKPKLSVEVGADPGRVWRLDIMAGNDVLLTREIEGTGSGKECTWQTVSVDLSNYASRETHLRLYQRVLIPKKLGGNAYWRALRLE